MLFRVRERSGREGKGEGGDKGEGRGGRKRRCSRREKSASEKKIRVEKLVL